jgi:hypothetical protein
MRVASKRPSTEREKDQEEDRDDRHDGEKAFAEHSELALSCAAPFSALFLFPYLSVFIRGFLQPTSSSSERSP